MSTDWTRAGFESLGFVGWKRFGRLAKGDLPDTRGVYVVIRDVTERPKFLAESVGGAHKRKPLTVGVDVLDHAWRDGAMVVYIGKAGGARGLADRLWAYARQGRGHSAGHAGGRFIWQLPASDQLLVGWREVEDVGDVEEALLALHIKHYGRRPFANMKDGLRIAPSEARDYLNRVFGD